MAHGNFSGNFSHSHFLWLFPFLGANQLSSGRRTHHLLLEPFLQSEPLKVSRLEHQWVTEVVFLNISISEAVGFCKNPPRRYPGKAHFPSYSVLQSPDDEVLHSAWIECPKKFPPNLCKMRVPLLPPLEKLREKSDLGTHLKSMFYRM